MSLADDPYAQPPIDTAASSAGLVAPPALQTRGRPARAGSGARVLAAAVAAFALGAATVAFLAWHGDLDRVLPRKMQEERSVSAPIEARASVPAMETRLALLEDRFSRLDQQANAAAGNAGRAEGLLIAQATRRAIERGQPLGYLADQLRLRFANAQPRAVETLIAFSERPVTLSTLDAQLDTLAPQLAATPRDATTWSRMRGALSGLFTIRSDPRPVLRPEERIGRVKLLLAEGQVDAAADAIARLPGSDVASGWTEDARRFEAAQQALDTIESTAMNAPPVLSQASSRAQAAPGDDAR